MDSAPRAAVKAPRLMAVGLWLDPRQDGRARVSRRRGARRKAEPSALAGRASAIRHPVSERRSPCHRRGHCGPERGGAPCRCRARGRRARSRVLSRAAVAAPIPIRRSASSSTTATICCSPATTRRWTISTASARARRSRDPGSRGLRLRRPQQRRALATRSQRRPHPLVAVRPRRSACRARRLREYLAPLAVFFARPAPRRSATRCPARDRSTSGSGARCCRRR